GGSAAVSSISCTTAGSCAAGGAYTDGSNRGRLFVVNEKNGVWRKAVEVPGSAALDRGDPDVSSISCATAGSFPAGGDYYGGSNRQRFLVQETNGVGRRAVAVPGSAALRLGGSAAVRSVSCTTAGSCAAGGAYTDGSNHQQAFVVNEKNGVWRKAVEVPGSAA